MMLLDGKLLASELKAEIAGEVSFLIKEGKRPPHLTAILVGNDGASRTYVDSKVKICGEVGFRSTLIEFDDSVSEAILLEKIDEINHNSEIDGLIVQLPLPPHIHVSNIIEAINPAKDVDGFHPMNSGRMLLNLPCHLPATPSGILQILKKYNIETSGKHCVVVGRSHIVGLPMSVLMGRNTSPGNCTVTLCHSKTHDIESVCRTADILIAAIGKPGFIKPDMVKPGAVVIDVGITRVNSDLTKSGFILKGDVEFESVSKVCSAITPVPGGVGPMTIIGLLQNTLRAAKSEIQFS